MTRAALAALIGLCTLIGLCRCGDSFGPSPAPTTDSAAQTAPRSSARQKFDALDGTEWIQDRQGEDGGWATGESPRPTDASDLELTALVAGMWLQRAVSNRGTSPAHRTMARALPFLMRAQDTQGRFRSGDFHTDLVATSALVHAFVQTSSAVWRRGAQSALTDLSTRLPRAALQSPHTAAWALTLLMHLRVISNHAATQPREADSPAFRALQYDESAFAKLSAWADIAPDPDPLRLAVGTLAGILFDPIDQAKVRLKERAAQLARIPFVWDARNGTADPLAVFLIGTIQRFVPRSAWHQETANTLAGTRRKASGRTHPHWSARDLMGFEGGDTRLTVLCTMIEMTFYSEYSMRNIEMYRLRAPSQAR